MSLQTINTSVWETARTDIHPDYEPWLVMVSGRLRNIGYVTVCRFRQENLHPKCGQQTATSPKRCFGLVATLFSTSASEHGAGDRIFKVFLQ